MVYLYLLRTGQTRNFVLIWVLFIRLWSIIWSKQTNTYLINIHVICNCLENISVLFILLLFNNFYVINPVCKLYVLQQKACIGLFLSGVFFFNLRWGYMLKCPKQPQISPLVIFKNWRWYWKEVSKILWGYLKSTNLYY